MIIFKGLMDQIFESEKPFRRYYFFWFGGSAWSFCDWIISI